MPVSSETPRSRNSPGRQLKIAAAGSGTASGCGKALGFLGALRQGPHLLNDSHEIVVDEHACLAGSARIDSLASQKTIQKSETLVVSWTPQSRNQIIHAGPQDPGLRSLGEVFDLDPRLLREGGPV